TSAARSDLEPGPSGRPAVRLGLASIRSIGDDLAGGIVAGRPPGGYRSVESVMAAMPDSATLPATLSTAQAEALATAGALDGLGEGVAAMPAVDREVVDPAAVDPAAADPAAADPETVGP